MKRYRVFYAGRPSEAVLLDAVDPTEAAYTFFANRPERNSIFVTIDGGLREWNFSIDELAQRFPDVPAILENLAGEKDVLKATLETQRRMEKAPEITPPWIHGMVTRFVVGGALALIAAGFGIYQAIRRETQVQPVNCGEFTTVLPHGWSIYRDLTTAEGVHLVKFEDDRHTLLNIYVFSKGTGSTPQQLLEFFGRQVEPLFQKEGATVTMSPIRDTTVFNLPGVTRSFVIETKNSRTPHTWQVVRVPFASHDVNVLVQFPDRDLLDATSGAEKIIAAIAPLPPSIGNGPSHESNSASP